MLAEALVVEQAGFATVQDLGRAGHAHLGISGNGASDGFAARVANSLVGNRDRAPLIEATASSFSFTARRRLLIAVTGAAGRVLLDATPAPSAEPIVVEASCRVTVQLGPVGHRCYVAINGALAATPVLGSVAPDPFLQVGRRLSAGDVVHVDSRFQVLDHPFFRLPLFRLDAPGAALSDTLVVEVTPGPDAGQFDGHLDDAPTPTFTVSPHSDYIGLRLLGPVPRRTVSTEILSRGVPVGAIEIPPTGGLIALLRGRLISAGYPIVAIATSIAVDRLGQLRPGDTVSFRMRTVEEAIAGLRQREQSLVALARRVDTVFRHIGLADVLDARHLSRESNDR